jgi:hypothetical protein
MSVLDPRRSWIGFLVLAGFSLTFALTALEPASSQGLAFLPRLLFWAVHNAAALVLLSVAQLAIARMRRLGAAPPFVQVALAGLLGAMLFTPVALGLDGLFEPFGTALADDSGLLDSLAEEFVALAPPLWLIWGLLNAPRLVHLHQHVAPAVPTAGEPAKSGREELSDLPAVHPDDSMLQEFWGRVPARLGRDIVALTAELHYLRVYTARGDDLIFMSFGRAVEALAAQRGFQIHRSHWVALAHVVGLEQTGGKLFCLLDTGLRLPVSRANRAVFKAAVGTSAPGA